MRYMTEYDGNLTHQLALERAQIVYNITKSQKRLGMLFEATGRRDNLDRKIELMQLNEILYHQNLYNRIIGEDLYSRVVRRTIAELRERGLVEEGSVLLSEGFWDSVQAGIGNFAGGVDKVLKKVKLKKEPKGWEEAQRIFQKIAREEGDKMVQDLVSAIEGEVEDFPVGKDRNGFFSGVNTIASTYDTVVAATKKPAGDEGHLPVEAANEIIRQLRIIVSKYIADTEREKGGMYATFGGGDAKQAAEQEKNESAHLPLPLLLEIDWEKEAAKLDDDEKAEGEEGEAAEDAEEIDPDAEFEKVMAGQDSPVFKRMTSLKAPMIIAGAGAAMGALGWLSYQPWFHDWVADILDISKTQSETFTGTWEEDIETAMTEANPGLEELGSIEQGGGGLAKQVSRLLGLGEGENLLGKDASLEDLKNAALKVGDGDLDKGLKGIAGLTEGRGDPDEAFAWMKRAIEDPSTVGADSVDGEGSLWKLWAGGTDRSGAPSFVEDIVNSASGAGADIDMSPKDIVGKLSDAGKDALEGMTGGDEQLATAMLKGQPDAWAERVEALKAAGEDVSGLGKGPGDMAARNGFWGGDGMWKAIKAGPKGMFSVGVGNKLKKFVVDKTISTIKSKIKKKAIATVASTTAAYMGLSTMLAGAAPVLAGIGLSTVVAGASLAVIRKQLGAKTSRMATLNALLQTLNMVEAEPVKEVEPEPGETSKVTITLYDADAEAGGGVKEENWRRGIPLLMERTEVEITGLTGDPELEQTGGVANFFLQSVDAGVPPRVDNLDQIPFVIQGIQEKLPDFDLAGDNVDITIIDKRTKEEIPEKPEDPHPAPVHEEEPDGDPVPPGSPFSPQQVAKGDHAIVVFDPDNARVWRILKKVTFKKYAQDAKRSKDDTAPELADRAARYDTILSKVKADGVFVNSDELEAELSKISSGNDGDPYRVVYHRTRKNKKGEEVKRKSSTGGYTDAGDVGAIGDVRKNIKGAPGSRPPKNQGSMTVIYLVGDDVLRALTDAGLEEDEAKTLANNAIAAWSKAGKKPKLKDLGLDDESEGADILKAASLAEAFDFVPRRRSAIVPVTKKFFRRVIREVRESRSSYKRASRMTHLAGI